MTEKAMMAIKGGPMRFNCEAGVVLGPGPLLEAVGGLPRDSVVQRALRELRILLQEAREKVDAAAAAVAVGTVGEEAGCSLTPLREPDAAEDAHEEN